MTLIRYFSSSSYKLLDRKIGIVYSSQNICFNKGKINMTKRSQYVKWHNNEKSLLLGLLGSKKVNGRPNKKEEERKINRSSE